MNIAAAAVTTGMSRLDQSATEVVKAVMPDSKADLPAAVVRETTNTIAAKADLEVLKMADKTVGTLLDVMS